MAEHLLLVEQAGDWKTHFPALPVVTAREYLSQGVAQGPAARRRVRIINLCRSYRYLSLGYYCSLLAEARGHKAIPAVGTMQEVSSRDLYGLMTDGLNASVPRALTAATTNGATASRTLTLMFGQCAERELQPFARRVFETFRCPILRVELKAQPQWRISSLRALSLHSLDAEQESAFFAALEHYLSRPWRQPRARPEYRYDLALLHDPQEDLPPSNPRALQKFQRVGRQLGLNVELIQPRDFARLAEYDALLIRETTRIGHHSFRFAKKAASEGMVVIDDPDSILRCTNKVFLAELLEANRVPRPRTLILRRETLLDVEAAIGYPVVLKIPEGSFSRGVFKASNRNELLDMAARLLRESDLILAQEFLYTEFDWRIGLLARRPLYACKYFMSKAHWQIVHHHSDGRHDEGRFETMAVEDAPADVVDVALKAANLIGDGLYGVDVKATPHGAVIIEVNDNPNLDSGIEDRVLGDDLYRRILGEMITRLERRRGLVQQC
ncbi:RimK family alpha-L-glutamate ligase [Thiorhodovibrio frisius]|uniref:Glutathione synthase/ribosomal protein S6 modification enzyme (Glutaminyl transferase) n=1 Tax=Thiorhodovibrio frisius TaxID=631362 RepID=H8Z378_9GAMM|nr:RimK family alpha-L-glutamate ligase [Thiorhodovibrio frisius]EIC21786.1 glutathione synthase/ribosomal protein S6 modification enzyme (glutaminyl transferase) [Thiorhodovibrio frisius]WPL21753.1 Alpha-aminoadipate--LysW ligase LysX [Thiorhodovibrio frisius]